MFKSATERVKTLFGAETEKISWKNWMETEKPQPWDQSGWERRRGGSPQQCWRFLLFPKDTQQLSEGLTTPLSATAAVGSMTPLDRLCSARLLVGVGGALMLHRSPRGSTQSLANPCSKKQPFWDWSWLPLGPPQKTSDPKPDTNGFCPPSVDGWTSCHIPGGCAC